MRKQMKTLIDRLARGDSLRPAEYEALIAQSDPEVMEYLFSRARKVQLREFGNKVFLRGLIEISSYCTNDCYYCGIRAGNANARRYRLDADQILACCERGYDLGFRTFVLQAGDDPFFSRDVVCGIVRRIKSRWNDCAVTLSLGEKSRDEYEAYFEAGADRYLLRHETANPAHYGRLHPDDMAHESRIRCLHDLKEIGFQVGAGFMVGSPFQTDRHLAEDLQFLAEFKPHMVGIGPFIRHQDTPFRDFPSGPLQKTLVLLAILRLLLPRAMLPATTALGSIDPHGREKGILAGANVVMPNLSPDEAREKYSLYDNKLSTGAEAAGGTRLLREKLAGIGYEIADGRGDWQPRAKEIGSCTTS